MTEAFRQYFELCGSLLYWLFVVIWGEYITAALVGKPSRLIFVSKANEVPTKEQLIEHMRRTHAPCSVRIKELETGAKLVPINPMPPEEKKKGLLDLFKRRE